MSAQKRGLQGGDLRRVSLACDPFSVAIAKHLSLGNLQRTEVLVAYNSRYQEHIAGFCLALVRILQLHYSVDHCGSMYVGAHNSFSKRSSKPGCPRTLYVDQTGLRHTDLPLPLPAEF